MHAKCDAGEIVRSESVQYFIGVKTRIGDLVSEGIPVGIAAGNYNFLVVQNIVDAQVQGYKIRIFSAGNTPGFTAKEVERISGRRFLLVDDGIPDRHIRRESAYKTGRAAHPVEFKPGISSVVQGQRCKPEILSFVADAERTRRLRRTRYVEVFLVHDSSIDNGYRFRTVV